MPDECLVDSQFMYEGVVISSGSNPQTEDKLFPYYSNPKFFADSDTYLYDCTQKPESFFSNAYMHLYNIMPTTPGDLATNADYHDQDPKQFPVRTDQFLRKARFGHLSASFAPAVVFQRRHPLRACEETSFADFIRNKMHYNPALPYAYSAPRDGTLWECVDKEGIQDDSWDTLIEARATELGREKVYALFAEYANGIPAYERIKFFDAQTAEITIASIVFTQNVEIFTSIRVIFMVGEGGAITSKVYKSDVIGCYRKAILGPYLTVCWSFC